MKFSHSSLITILIYILTPVLISGSVGNKKDKSKYQYLDSVVYQMPNSDSEFENNRKIIFVYDDFNRLTFETKYLWSNQKNNWINNEKIDYIYNNSHRLIARNTYNWDTIVQTWYEKESVIYTFDNNDNITNKRYSCFDETQQKMMLYSEYINEYDINNNLITETYFQNSADIDCPCSTTYPFTNFKTKYTYNTAGEIIDEIEFVWHKKNKEFVFKKRHEIISETNIISRIDSEWDTIQNIWIPKTNSVIYQNEDNKDTLQVIYEWNSNLNQLLAYHKTSVEYDSNKNKIQEIQYQKNNDELSPAYKYIWEYDEYNNISLLTIYHWDKELQEWYKYGKKVYTYNDNNVKINEKTFYTKDDDNWETEYAEKIYNDYGQILYDGYMEYTYNNSGLPLTVGDNFEYEYNENNRIKSFSKHLGITCGQSSCGGSPPFSSEFTYSFVVSDDNLVLPKQNLTSVMAGIVHINSYDTQEQAKQAVNEIKPGELGYEVNFASYTTIASGGYFDISEKRTLYFSELETNSTNIEKTTTDTNNITVYPNPVKEYLFVTIPTHINTYTLKLYNTSGTCVMEKANKNILKIGTLKKGMYILQLEVDNSTISSVKVLKK